MAGLGKVALNVRHTFQFVVMKREGLAAMLLQEALIKSQASALQPVISTVRGSEWSPLNAATTGDTRICCSD